MAGSRMAQHVGWLNAAGGVRVCTCVQCSGVSIPAVERTSLLYPPAPLSVVLLLCALLLSFMFLFVFTFHLQALPFPLLLGLHVFPFVCPFLRVNTSGLSLWPRSLFTPYALNSSYKALHLGPSCDAR